MECMGLETPPDPSQLGEARSRRTPSGLCSVLKVLTRAERCQPDSLSFFLFNFKRTHLQAVIHTAMGPEGSS